MHFTKIAGQNFGPFEKFEYDLVRGSIGMFGSNGKGKSTLFNAFYAILSNDFSRYGRLKVDCIRSNAGEKDKAFLYGEIEHNGHKLCIMRSLRPSKQEMTVDDGKPITNDIKIEEELQSLGIDRKVLDLYVFKQQDRIFDFLLTTPTERAKAFAVLCRTAHCQKIWQVIGEHLNKDADVNAQIVDNSDDLTQDIGALEDQAEGLKKRRGEQEPMLLNDKSLESARAILKRRDRLAQLVEDKEEETERLPALQKTAVEAQEAYAVAEERVTAMSTKVKADRESVAAARASLKSAKLYRNYRDQAAVLREEKKRLDAAEAKVKPPKKPEGYSAKALEALREEVRAKKAELAKAEAVVKRFEADGVVECPTCGTPVTDLKDHIKQQKKLTKTLGPEIDELVQKGKSYAAYVTEQAEYDSLVADLAKQQLRLQRDLAGLIQVDAPEGDEESFKKTIAEFEEKEGKLETRRTKRDESQKAKAKAESALEACERRLAEIAKQEEDNAVDPEKVATVEKRMDEHTTATTNIAGMDGELRGIESAIKGKQKDLDALQARLDRGKQVRRVAKIAEQLRELFDPKDGLPKDVAQENLAEMEYDINEGLKIFGDPFWVQAGEDLSFIIHPPDKAPHPAVWLSTGQRVVLAIAFWPAVASLWSSDLGMLGLDEPTANLDASNRRFLADALVEMTAKVRGKRQVIVVTHDPDLRSAFDQVIDLG